MPDQPNQPNQSTCDHPLEMAVRVQNLLAWQCDRCGHLTVTQVTLGEWNS